VNGIDWKSLGQRIEKSESDWRETGDDNKTAVEILEVIGDLLHSAAAHYRETGELDELLAALVKRAVPYSALIGANEREEAPID